VCIPVLVVSAGLARGQDEALAASFATAAAKLAADGKMDKARELCFKALANNDDCAEALYELGKIFEKEGRSVAAGDFLTRAARLFAREEGGNPAVALKRSDAERRAKTLNPCGTRYAEIMTGYAQDLGAIAKKTPDSLTAEEVMDRVTTLQLASVVPPDKLPALEKPAPKVAAKTDPTRRPTVAVDDDDVVRPVAKKEVVNNTPPDVERALKAAGWTTVKGTWKKKEGTANVYEVTNGTLEAAKTNGAVQAIVHKGGTGKARVMVRNSREAASEYSSYSASGYGFQVTGSVAKMYSASGGYLYSTTSGIYRPYFERDIPLNNPRNKIFIQIMDGKLEMYVNDKREHNSNYKLSKDGPFIIEVDGTMTIEDPKAAGQ
jgi:hypothetical protein